MTTNVISSRFEHGFAPSCLRYSAASRLYDLAGERIEIRSQPRHNIDEHRTEKNVPKSSKNRSKIDGNRFLEPCWLKMTPPWSHLGPRWARGSIFHRFLINFEGSKMHKRSIQKPSNFQTSLETLFSANRVHKSSKMRVQNHSKIQSFLGRVKNRESCSRLHADLVFEV